VRALVLANPGGLDRGGGGIATRLITGLMSRFFAAGARGARWFPAAFAAYYRTVLPRRAAAAQRRRIVAAGREMAPLLRDAWRGFGAPETDVRPLVQQVGCPTLFAWAVRDRFVQLRRARATIARFPNATLETFPAGHAPHLETPTEFAQTVDRFLATLAPW